ncbi:MAG TPA: glycosyltransferase [Blastocatellia bacterium]|nr:glycosyltransferase [Blastocatellia bacterium]
MTEILISFHQYFTWFVVTYFLALNTIYLCLMIGSYFGLRRYHLENRYEDFQEVVSFELAPPLSLLVPAHNEGRVIVENVRSLLGLRYPRMEIIIINDGSKDDTLEQLINGFDLELTPRVYWKTVECQTVRGIYWNPACPNLWVIDKVNGRKADAINAGINLARYPYVCVIDGDCILDRDAMLRVMKPVIRNRWETMAAGGTVRIVNGCRVGPGLIAEVRTPKSYLANVQIIEYLRAFLFGRMGWEAVDGLLIISGAFGVFRRDVLVEINGFRHDTIGEDMDVVVRLHRHLRKQKRPYRIAFIPDPVCWTECPEDWKMLCSQRQRWQRGLRQALQHSREMLFNPKYGRIGLIVMPYFVIFEYLAPLVEVLGYLFLPLSWFLGLLDHRVFVLFLATAIVYSLLLSLGSLVLEEISFRRYSTPRQLLRLFFYAVLENFLFRQVHAWWRFAALFPPRKSRNLWESIARKGFEKT